MPNVVGLHLLQMYIRTTIITKIIVVI